MGATNCENVNGAWTNFKQLFTDVLIKCAPIKSVWLKQRSGIWFSGEIVSLLHQRCKAVITFRKSKMEADYAMYKELEELMSKINQQT